MQKVDDEVIIKLPLRCWHVDAVTSILGAVKKHIYLLTLLLQVNFVTLLLQINFVINYLSNLATASQSRWSVKSGSDCI